MGLISIIDYGSGNLKSVYNAVNHLSNQKRKEKVVVTSSISDIKDASHIILPGVGSFQSCVKGLKRSSLVNVIQEKVCNFKTPFLGICVGMQMLASKGYEKGEFSGLDWIKGKVKKISDNNKNLKIPHMGWNDINFKVNTPFIENLKKKINYNGQNRFSAYFIHSYNFLVSDQSEKILTTSYGQEITAMVSRENIIGTQFHPEKSHFFGLAFLQTFLESEEYR